jgi:NAD(P)-dependent dehydrogenase (short-subunit alcohol dehydrogenase family)
LEAFKEGGGLGKLTGRGVLITGGSIGRRLSTADHLSAESAQADLAIRMSFGRLACPEELFKAVGFLACDDGSYVAGIDLSFDGGFGRARERRRSKNE